MAWRGQEAEPDIGALVVLFERPSGDGDGTDDDTAAPDQASGEAGHDGCSRHVDDLRECCGARLLHAHQVTAVAVEQRDGRRFRRGDTGRHRIGAVHTVENLQVPAAVDDGDRDSRADFGGVIAYAVALLAALDEFGPHSQVQIGQRCGTMTAAGRHRLEELDRTLTEVQHDILNALSATERDTLTMLLTRILDY